MRSKIVIDQILRNVEAAAPTWMWCCIWICRCTNCRQRGTVRRSPKN